MIREGANTYTAAIYIAGPQTEAEQICRRFCLVTSCTSWRSIYNRVMPLGSTCTTWAFQSLS